MTSRDVEHVEPEGTRLPRPDLEGDLGFRIEGIGLVPIETVDERGRGWRGDGAHARIEARAWAPETDLGFRVAGPDLEPRRRVRNGRDEVGARGALRVRVCDPALE